MKKGMNKLYDFILDNIVSFVYIAFALWCILFGVLSMSKYKFVYSNTFVMLFVTVVIFIRPVYRTIIGTMEITFFDCLLIGGFIIIATRIIYKRDLNVYTLCNVSYDNFYEHIISKYSDDFKGLNIDNNDLPNIFIKKNGNNEVKINLRYNKKNKKEIIRITRLAAKDLNTRQYSFAAVFIILAGCLFFRFFI